MSSGGIFIGTAGVYYVMAELSLRHYHAAATHGNAPDFDILVCNPEGDKSATIQVKSTRWGTRNNHFDFPLSYRAAKMKRETFFVAFVDFDPEKPDIYLVPSMDLHQKCKDWIDKYEGRMIRFKPELGWMEQFKVKDNWDRLTAIGIVASQTVPSGEADPSTDSG